MSDGAKIAIAPFDPVSEVNASIQAVGEGSKRVEMVGTGGADGGTGKETETAEDDLASLDELIRVLLEIITDCLSSRFKFSLFVRLNSLTKSILHQNHSFEH